MNPGFKYPSPGCEVETPEASSDVQKMFLEAHLKAAQCTMGSAHSELLQVSVQPVSEPSGGFTAQKLQRPYIPEDCTENQWSFVLDK